MMFTGTGDETENLIMKSRKSETCQRAKHLQPRYTKQSPWLELSICAQPWGLEDHQAFTSVCELRILLNHSLLR